MKELLQYLIYKTIVTLNFIRRIEWRTMLKYLDPKKGEQILDVACGTGELSCKVAERGCIVFGIDISENAVERSTNLAKKAGLKCNFMVGDAGDLPYPNMYFDKIVCSSALEHFDDDIKALKEMNRVLKLNGRIVITVDSLTYPISDILKQRHKMLFSVVNYYTRESLKERFSTTGIKLNRSEYLLNSKITNIFYNYFIVTWREHTILWTFISLIAYPLCLVSDKLWGMKDKGYTLIVEGKK